MIAMTSEWSIPLEQHDRDRGPVAPFAMQSSGSVSRPLRRRIVDQVSDEISRGKVQMVVGISTVGFFKREPRTTFVPEKSNWAVYHSTIDNSFQIEIRLDSEIDLAKLKLPPLCTSSRDRPSDSGTKR